MTPTTSRMTRKEESGSWQVKGLSWEMLQPGRTITKETSQLLYGCLCKLKDYEESRLNPDQVKDLQYEAESLAAHVCDSLCRYSQEAAGQEELDEACRKCPLTDSMKCICGMREKG